MAWDDCPDVPVAASCVVADDVDEADREGAAAGEVGVGTTPVDEMTAPGAVGIGVVAVVDDDVAASATAGTHVVKAAAAAAPHRTIRI